MTTLPSRLPSNAPVRASLRGILAGQTGGQGQDRTVDLPLFRPDVSPSRHVKCECSCVLPTAAVGRWLVLLLSRLLSGHRWPDAAPASDAGIGHYQALVSEFRSTAWRPPLDGLRPGSYHGFHDLPCFRVRREPAQDEGEAGGDHGVAVAVAEDAAAAGQDVFVQLLGRLVLAQLGQRAAESWARTTPTPWPPPSTSPPIWPRWASTRRPRS